jgi:protein phosphatase 1 regulatory subunit 7
MTQRYVDGRLYMLILQIISRQDLELLHSRIGSLDTLSLSRFAGHLKRLCLRQNSISFLDPAVFHQLTLLEELDLYDNKLKSIGNALEKCSNLK